MFQLLGYVPIISGTMAPFSLYSGSVTRGHYLPLFLIGPLMASSLNYFTEHFDLEAKIIREVLDSILGPETGYPDCRFRDLPQYLRENASRLVKVKLKLSLCFTSAPRHEDVLGSGGIVPAFLTSALDGCEWSALHSGRFTPRERAPGTHCVGRWMGTRSGLVAVMKRKIPSPCRD
jgi:hypothetical protein